MATLFQRILGDRELTGKAQEEWLVQRVSLVAAIEHLTAVLGDSDILDVIRRHEEPSAICTALVKAAVDGRCEHNVTVVAATPIVVPDEPQNHGGWR